MKKAITILICILCLLGCEAVGYVASTRSNKPIKSDFSYYQENFKLINGQSKLRTDGIYLRVEYAVVDRYPIKDTLNWVYRFFETGQAYRTRYVRKKYEHDNLENVTRAYYKLNGENISIESFAPGRKEYWYWSGTIKDDILHITSVKGEGNKKRGYKAQKEINEIYIFKEIPDLKKSVEPNW